MEELLRWVPEDHPQGHKDCPLSDVDCDELWPWGKVHPHDAGPPTRDAKLGDNLVGSAIVLLVMGASSILSLGWRPTTTW
eukprot:236273-Hanusia_phi.AAC.1